MKGKKPISSDLLSNAEPTFKSFEYSSVKSSGEDLRQLLHELQADRIELEVKNEELRGAQAELEESRSRYTDFYDSVPIGYLTLDQQGLIVEANLAAASQLGTERANLLKKSFFSFLFESDRDVFGLHLAKVFKARQRRTCEVKIDPGRPEGFLARLDSIFIKNASGNGLVRTSLSDISSPKHAGEILRESEEKFRQLAESIREVFWIQEQRGLLYISPACEQIFGLSSGSLIEDPDLLIDIVHPEDRGRVLSTQLAGYANKESVGEYRVIRPDGSIRWIYSRSFPVRIGDDHVRTVGIAEDITERKQAEDALRQREKELMVLAGRLISTQEEELRQLSRELHDDLTQKLAVLAMDAGMLEQQLRSLQTQTAEEARDLKLKLIEVSEEVHDLSRQLHPSILDDLGLAQALKSEFAIFTKRTGIALFFAPRDVPMAIPGDIALCLYRVIQEGLRNIATHARTNKARIVLEGSDESVCLSIQDFGIGFDMRQVKEKTGIGLASMRERVRLVGGTMSLNSEPGEGTGIEISIPLGVKRE